MRYLLFFFFITITTFCISQNRKFDHLEHLYDQGHYAKVKRKASNLMLNPEYDFSSVPKLYQSISTFQLIISNKNHIFTTINFEEAIKNYRLFLTEDYNKKIFFAHKHELAQLRHNLIKWLEKNSNNHRKKKKIDQVTFLITNFFKQNLKVVKIKNSTKTKTKKKTKKRKKKKKYNFEKENAPKKTIEEQIIDYAKTFLGTKYKWAGTSPKGFDCSGYTLYVMEHFEKKLPRKAHDQYLKSTKKKLNHVKAGDLVFFGKKRAVNHVGIILSNKENQPIMIHASTSSGVIITDINKSKYWKPKIVGYGSF